MGEGIKTRRGESKGIIDTNTYLYNEGDECTALTGGWIQGILRDSGGTNVVTTKESTYMKYIVTVTVPLPTYGGFYTVNKINLTNYTKLCFKVSGSCTVGDVANRYFGTLNSVIKNNSISLNDFFTSYINDNTVPTLVDTVFQLDVTALSSSYHIGLFSGYNESTSTLYIYEVWLE